MSEIAFAFALALIVMTSFIILVDGTKIYFKKNIYPYTNLKKKRDDDPNLISDEHDDDAENEANALRYKNEEYKVILITTM